nr:DNA primase [Candidatus Woesearchaeota archaeon]
MGKISPVSAKYIVHTQIDIEGVVDKPDVIGAIFGQVEGLLGEDLELRELQRSGRIGRIEVNTETRAGKTSGNIIIPSSLDKAETAIVAAALETIQRIGPCNSRVKVDTIEDVRISKRNFIIERAKALLKDLTEKVLPDSQEITDEVSQSVRTMEIMEYGTERLSAGPAIDESDEIIVVEGRADVLNLLKHGFKNAIAMNGTSMPKTIIDLSRKKTIILFVDGDRGGDLIVKEAGIVAEIDYVAKAPDGKEVEEITKKEIHKSLRGRVSLEQIKMDIDKKPDNYTLDERRFERIRRNVSKNNESKLSTREKDTFKNMLEDLMGTRGAYILDPELNILGKVPISELNTTIKNMNSAFAVVFDGSITNDIAGTAEKSNVKYLVGMDSDVKGSLKTEIITNSSF